MTNALSFRDTLSVLSKSSSYAVSTESDTSTLSGLAKVKSYLYIKTDIEQDFKDILIGLASSETQFIFLCGSSGDGKSEILTRYSSKVVYKSVVDFHLDATHSFKPDTNAITTLNERFHESKLSNRPLVVGINLGMMANYARGGADEHQEIRDAMQAHLEGCKPAVDYVFLNFEDKKYAKFEFSGHIAKSPFAKKLMQKLTAKEYLNEINPFWQAVNTSVELNQDAKFIANFRLLAMDAVQDVIIEALMKARLIKDQFMTARALLDFIYHLLTGPGYLYDNLFSGADNELARSIAEFDPVANRTRKLDEFILHLKLGQPDSEFNCFNLALNELGVEGINSSTSYIRLFFLFRKVVFANDYHKGFAKEFDDKLLEEFAMVHQAQQYLNKTDPPEQMAKLTDFYKFKLVPALWRYMNRNAPALKSKQYLVAEHNDVLVAAEMKFKPDWAAIKADSTNSPAFFNVHLQVNGEKLDATPPININLFELLTKLNEGYRPNKHDKSCVLILDELVEHIHNLMANCETLLFIDNGKAYEVELDQGYIEATEA